jgi:tRNA G18 (ribose-2'-O)-methylase SpoU
VYQAEREVVERIVGFDLHRGILASCHRGEGRRVADLAASCETLVVLEDLANHDNVGGIFRCVAALAGPRAGVVLSPRCCDPLYRKSIRVSTGHVLRVPFARSADWPADLGRLRDSGHSVIALDAGEGATDIGAVARPARLALLVGAEGPGLTGEALAEAGCRARIAMTPGVDSLNAVVACAIALHRLVRAGP